MPMSNSCSGIYPAEVSLSAQQNDDDDNFQNEYVEKSLGCFGIDSHLRQWLINICTPGSNFDNFILAMIVLNAVSMACIDYRHVDENYEPIAEKSLRNMIIEKAEIVFLVIFILECFIKIMAFGLIQGKKAYLRSAWNTFDFLIVLCR